MKSSELLGEWELEKVIHEENMDAHDVFSDETRFPDTVIEEALKGRHRFSSSSKNEGESKS